MSLTLESPREVADPEFAHEVLTGLSAPRRSLPCRFFYDAVGSELFEEITQLEEYYPTRTELAILAACGDEISARTLPGTALIELGSGSSRKTELLLEKIPALSCYVPIDVCGEALQQASRRLQDRFPRLVIEPVIGDFSAEVELPRIARNSPKLGFFPGSTIGNFQPRQARDLLGRVARLLAPAGRLVLGIDLQKSPSRLVAAYDDAAGVTARFNLNLLTRINRELEGTFDVDRFRHSAVWNSKHGRIDMFLVSQCRQQVNVLGRRFVFEAGEMIHTEHSYKYTIESFRHLATSAGWSPRAAWTDPERLFSVHELALDPRLN